MVRELLLLRSGESDWKPGVDDGIKSLNDTGKRSAQRIGTWLATNSMIPDYIISSTAKNALVTAEKTCKAMGRGSGIIVQEPKIYLASIEDLYEIIRKIPDKTGRVMLVGHNPGLELLLANLINDQIAPENDTNLLPTASLAILQVHNDWSELKPGSARLERIIHPHTLPKKFPWPLMEGKESRDRPAYYYSQSSVIPYRICDGKPEVLIIRSSKKKHWVVPKGIHEPGLTSQESAAKEALEEAGVVGKIDTELVGSYRYMKWGASCIVDVYSMEVSRIIPEIEWEESYRTRKWVSPKQAATLVRQKELGSMIMSLTT